MLIVKILIAILQITGTLIIAFATAAIIRELLNSGGEL